MTHLIVDAHADLAYNMLRHGRDYTRSAAETREIEKNNADVLKENENALIGWADYQRGKVALLFSTLFALPARWNKDNPNTKQVYKTFDEAHKICREQLQTYQRMTDSTPDKFQLVTSRAALESLLVHWNSAGGNGSPVGMVPLMEGAEGIRGLNELEEWYELGLRLIGPAWVGTRYCGGWREPGPLTADGRKLLSAMADYNFILDLSHMDGASSIEALDIYRGPVVATHANCEALLPNSNSNRHLSDRIIEGIVERDGVIGVVLFNAYLKSGWVAGKNPREDVPLGIVADHIDHICQIAGDSLHVGIGTDFDGGFGVESVSPEIDTIADLQKLSPLLQVRGYSDADVANIFGGNWITRLKRDLP